LDRACGITQTHQDSQLYPEPERFDPDRFSSERSAKPFSYVPFGGGLRECLGKEFARLEMKLFAAKIVREFEWELVTGSRFEFDRSTDSASPRRFASKISSHNYE
jgi:cytochrome P450